MTTRTFLEYRNPIANSEAKLKKKVEAAKAKAAKMKPCGTNAAIRRHQRAGEPLSACPLCRVEYNRLHREYYAQRKTKSEKSSVNRLTDVVITGTLQE